MDNALLISFKKDIENIKEYIEHISLIDAVAIKNKKPEQEELKNLVKHLHTFKTDKKLFEYKAITVSLYGILEKYIGTWIREYIDTLSDLIVKYDDLPLKLRESHFKLSINLISKIIEKKFAKYEHLDKNDVLLKLGSCIRESSKFELNEDAFSPMSGNLKHGKITEAFEKLCIELNGKLLQNKSFLEYLETKHGSDIANKKPTVLYNVIDDLVSRRNDIAHGARIDDTILDFDEHIEFLEYYCEAIFKVLEQETMKYKSEHLYTKIENILNVFKDSKTEINSILHIEVKNCKIKVGDCIMIKNLNSFTEKEISEIRRDKIKYEELEIKEKTNITVNINFSTTKNKTFYIKK